MTLILNMLILVVYFYIKIDVISISKSFTMKYIIPMANLHVSEGVHLHPLIF